MDITRDTLNALYTGFKKTFQDAFKGVTPQYRAIANRCAIEERGGDLCLARRHAAHARMDR